MGDLHPSEWYSEILKPSQMFPDTFVWVAEPHSFALQVSEPGEPLGYA